MLGELRTRCLDKYIQASARLCRAGRLMKRIWEIMSRISPGKRPHPLDHPLRMVHNYKDITATTSTEMPDGSRFAPACAPPAGLRGSRRRASTSRGGDGSALPRQRILRPERPGPGQIRDAAQRGERRACGGGGGGSLWVVSARLLRDARLVQPRGPTWAFASQARTEAPTQAHGGKPCRPGAGRARGRTYAKRRGVGRVCWPNAAASAPIPAASCDDCFRI